MGAAVVLSAIFKADRARPLARLADRLYLRAAVLSATIEPGEEIRHAC